MVNMSDYYRQQGYRYKRHQEEAPHGAEFFTTSRGAILWRHPGRTQEISNYMKHIKKMKTEDTQEHRDKVRDISRALKGVLKSKPQTLHNIKVMIENLFANPYPEEGSRLNLPKGKEYVVVNEIDSSKFKTIQKEHPEANYIFFGNVFDDSALMGELLVAKIKNPEQIIFTKDCVKPQNVTRARLFMSLPLEVNIDDLIVSKFDKVEDATFTFNPTSLSSDSFAFVDKDSALHIKNIRDISSSKEETEEWEDEF